MLERGEGGGVRYMVRVQYIARFRTSMGELAARLTPEFAPIAVDNFVSLARGERPWKDPETNMTHSNSPFFNGLLFHRVIKDFIVHGGCPLNSGTAGPGYSFADEFVDEASHDRFGTLTMINAGPNTNGSQFAFTLDATKWLDGKHTVFGYLTEGADVLKAIGDVETESGDKPRNNIIIHEVRIEESDLS